MSQNRLIALDGDGVMLDYNRVFPSVWFAAFGEHLESKVPNSYHAVTEFGVSLEDPAVEERFFEHFDASVWERIPALDGALAAAIALSNAGHELVCVTSMPSKYQLARLRNLQALGFPIEQVFAVDRTCRGQNPKQSVIEKLNPAVFVDDLAHNFRNLPAQVHKALVHSGHHDSPNTPELRALADSEHASLAAFAQAWLRTC